MLKGLLWTIFLLTLVYLRLLRRQRRNGRTCPLCGQADPHHRSH